MAGDGKWRVKRWVITTPVVLASLLTVAAIAVFRHSAAGVAARQEAPSLSPPAPCADCLVRAPAKIAENVYLLGDIRPSAVYVVETSAGLALVDAGSDSARDRLLAGLAKLNLDVDRIKLILLTHAHGDHTMGAQWLRERTGARVYIGRGDAAPLRRGGPREAIFSKFDLHRDTPHPVTIDGELADQQVIELGQARFTVIATPGHTPGSCCFLLETAGTRILFTGDTISAFTAGTGTYAAALPPRYRGDAEQYLNSLEKLRRLPAPGMVLPGHPTADPAAADAHLTEKQWKGLVDRGLNDIRLLLRRYARDGADFLDATPKQLSHGVYYLGDLEGHAVYALVSTDRALVFGGARGRDAAGWVRSALKSVCPDSPDVAVLALTSDDPENLAGLRDFVSRTGCAVVAPAKAIESVLAGCPAGTTVASSDEMRRVGWGEISALSLDGLGRHEASYYFHREGALVLVSGSLPVDADLSEFTTLRRAGPPAGWSSASLAESLRRLEEIHPDLWLSTSPLHGRNANLYDRAWINTLKWNRELRQQWMSGNRLGMPESEQRGAIVEWTGS